jgi:hypothetical protein
LFVYVRKVKNGYVIREGEEGKDETVILDGQDLQGRMRDILKKYRDYVQEWIDRASTAESSYLELQIG